MKVSELVNGEIPKIKIPANDPSKTKCDRCDALALWNVRAYTIKLCNECYRKLEWSRV